MTKDEPTEEQLRQSQAWPQGFGWWYVWQQGGRLIGYFHKGQRPLKGTRNIRHGKGAAYRGIQDPLGGGGFEGIMPMGVVSVHLDQSEITPGKSGAITFRPRIRNRTPRIPA